MRNAHLLTLIFLLFFSSASEAGILSYAIGQSTGQSNAQYEANQKAIQEGRISCVPQQDSLKFWTCTDAYGNQFPDLIISKKSEETKKKTK